MNQESKHFPEISRTLVIFFTDSEFPNYLRCKKFWEVGTWLPWKEELSFSKEEKMGNDWASSSTQQMGDFLVKIQRAIL